MCARNLQDGVVGTTYVRDGSEVAGQPKAQSRREGYHWSAPMLDNRDMNGGTQVR